MRSLLQDLRWAVGGLARDRAFTAVAVLVLALALGLNSAVFSLVEAVFLRPSPLRAPEELVLLWGRDERGGLHSIAPYDFLALGEQPQILSGIAGMVTGSEVGLILSGLGDPERVPAALVTSGFFRTLGTVPALGRLPSMEECSGGGPRVVLLSERLWRRRFGGDPGVVGRPVTLTGRSFTVIGVLPSAFDFPDGVEIWIPDPFHASEILDLGIEASYAFTVVARLSPGIDIRRARQALKGAVQSLAADGSRVSDLALVPLDEDRVSGVRPLLVAVSGAVAFLLLIACSNLTNLFLVRRHIRSGDLAVRAVVGATRFRLARLAAAEGVLIAACAALLGTLLSMAAVRLLLAFAPGELAVFRPSGTRPAVLAFMFLVSAAVGGLLGLGPAVGALRLSLRQNVAKRAGGRSRVHGPLVATEIGLTLVLLVGAGLMASTLFRLMHSELGFEPGGVLTLKLTLPSTKYGGLERKAELYNRVIERLRALPLVDQVGGADSLPILGGGFETLFFLDGAAPPEPGREPMTRCAAVLGRYFSTMEIRLLRGRLLQRSDHRGSAPVVVVDETFARRFWPGKDPLGRRLSIQGRWREVVGIVRSVRVRSLTGSWEPQVYLPYEQAPFAWPFFFLVARTRVDPEDLIPAVRAAIREIDRDQPIDNVRAYRRILAEALGRQRLALLLIGTFAALSLVLSVVGLYGVVAYSAAQRTREIGIRMALGARVGDIIRLILRPTLLSVGAGLLAGLTLAFVLTRLLESLLYGVTPNDPWHLAAVSLLMGAVSAVASFLPAWNASRLAPLHAMRPR